MMMVIGAGAGGPGRPGCERKLKQNIFIHCVLDLHSWRKDLREDGGSNSLRGIERLKRGIQFSVLFSFCFRDFFLTHTPTAPTQTKRCIFPLFLDRYSDSQMPERYVS